jgi:3-hydroxyacyl-CoA dehydrogenase
MSMADFSFPATPATVVQTIAVVGAGAVGRGIALATALAGYRTVLEDILPGTLRSAESDIRGLLDASVQRGDVTALKAEKALGRIEYGSSIEDAVRRADFVIEAVPDEIESKLEIFSLLDRISRPNTILASSTFSLRITDITDVTHCAERCVGMRFVLPVESMKTVEIVRAVETSEATWAAALEVGGRLGKEIEIVVESREIVVPG